MVADFSITKQHCWSIFGYVRGVASEKSSHLAKWASEADGHKVLNNIFFHFPNIYFEYPSAGYNDHI